MDAEQGGSRPAADTAHYFDYAATSPQDEEILRESLEISLGSFANPSSAHKAGAAARRVLDEARGSCARTLGVRADQVFFTSGGTEGDHIPLLSVLNAPSKSGRIIVSAVEHPALREECAVLKKIGFDVVSALPDKNGFVSAGSVTELLTDDTLFVTVMAVNNETGCVQPIYEIADALSEAARGRRRPHFHVDCVQAAGKIPLDLSHAGIDSASLSAHKIAGPRGAGLLYLARPLKPFLVGGGQEQNIRSGTENIFGAVALSKCLAKYYLDARNPCQPAMERFVRQKELTLGFLKKLMTLGRCRLVPALRSNPDGRTEERFSPWIVQAAFMGIPGNVMVRALDAEGFSISTGSACSARKQSRPVLAAMGAERGVQDSAVRFSFGASTTEQAMDELFEAVKSVTESF